MAGKRPKPADHQGERWTDRQVDKIRDLVKGNTPTGLIAWELGRSEGAVRSKASHERISLDPPNRSPYNRRKK